MNLHRRLVVVLCVDLSQASELIAMVETLIENIRERIDAILSRESNYLTKESLRQQARQRLGESHEDISEMDPLLAPLVIVGTKYDLLQVTAAAAE